METDNAAAAAIKMQTPKHSKFNSLLLTFGCPLVAVSGVVAVHGGRGDGAGPVQGVRGDVGVGVLVRLSVVERGERRRRGRRRRPV